MSNAQKTPASRTLPKFVTRVAEDQIAQRFVSLPGNVTAVNANGTIVTVQLSVPGLNLQPVEMAVATSKYARPPIVSGDPGRAVSSTAYIGAVTGLGTGSQAPSGLQPNLSALVWEPISNTEWEGNPANGVYTDATGTAILSLTASEASLAFGSTSVVINASGITLTFGSKVVSLASAGLTIDGLLFDTHVHPYSGGTTSGPESP